MLNLVAPEWKILGPLGRGGMAFVLKVQNPDSGKIYAMKVAIPEARDELIREVAICSKLLHPNIIQYVNSFRIEIVGETIIQSTPPTIDIAMLLELADTDLSKLLDSAIDLKLKWSRELISALIYLKEKGVIHRDVKMNNVLIHLNSAKLADFGTAIEVADIKQDGELYGTPICQSPEVLEGKPYSYNSDTWALGILLFLLFEGSYPWNLKGNAREYYNDVLSTPSKVPSYGRREILRFLDPDPNERIPIEKALSLKMFQERVVLSELDKFKQARAEFGQGTREEFYGFLACMYPDDPPMSFNNFNKLYNSLY